MANFIEKLFRIDQRVLKKYDKMADNVIAYEEEMAKLSDEELQEFIDTGMLSLEHISLYTDGIL